jgi:hypothetical protein
MGLISELPRDPSRDIAPEVGFHRFRANILFAIAYNNEISSIVKGLVWW